jgi:prepilin-type N-terminal cleavage/methylation domain-containing protein
MTIQKLIPHHFSDRTCSFLKKGFTLLELTVVISVLLLLMGLGIASYSGYREWQLQTEAETTLRMVYTAQQTYLSEHPTEAVDTLKDGTEDEEEGVITLIDYLSDSSGALPVPEGPSGENLLINVKVSPPVFSNDPSGDDDDGKWDLGG